MGQIKSQFYATFLRHLKRVAVPCEDILFYIAVIRPVMEYAGLYAAPVWHTGLTTELAENMQSIQKRALRIIFGENSFTISSYHSFCDSLAVSSLYERRDKLLSADFFSTKFFTRQAVSVTYSPIKDIKESLVVPSAVRTYTKI